jgi:hypothetical protein
MEPDVIRYVLAVFKELLIDRIPLADEYKDILETVDREADKKARQHLGGSSRYIAKTNEETLVNNAKRDQAIREGWKNCEPQTLIAARYGITRQRVNQIIRGG